MQFHSSISCILHDFFLGTLFFNYFDNLFDYFWFFMTLHHMKFIIRNYCIMYVWMTWRSHLLLINKFWILICLIHHAEHWRTLEAHMALHKRYFIGVVHHGPDCHKLWSCSLTIPRTPSFLQCHHFQQLQDGFPVRCNSNIALSIFVI